MACDGYRRGYVSFAHFCYILEGTKNYLNAAYFSVDTAFLQGVKKFFRIGEEIKELVDPYFLMNFAGKEVKKHYKNTSC